MSDIRAAVNHRGPSLSGGNCCDFAVLFCSRQSRSIDSWSFDSLHPIGKWMYRFVLTKRATARYAQALGKGWGKVGKWMECTAKKQGWTSSILITRRFNGMTVTRDFHVR